MNVEKLNARKRACKITLEELLLVNLLLGEFTCLSEGTIASREKNLTDIILILNPPFIFKENNMSLEEKLEFFLPKAHALFNSRISVTCRIRNQIKQRQNIYQAKILNKQVNEFFFSIAGSLKGPKFVKFLIWDRITLVDRINNRNVVLFTRQAVCFDTVMIYNNIYITIITDFASRKLLQILITDASPTSQHLIYMFDTFLSPDIRSRLKIVHCDRCGSNLSNEFLSYFEKININLSFTTDRYKNQVAEAINRAIKNLIERLRFSNYPKTDFFSLPYKYKLRIIKKAFVLFNLSKTTTRSSFLQGYSRETVDFAKEFLCKLFPDLVNKNLVMVSSSSKDGQFFCDWTKIYIQFFVSYQKLQSINIEFNITINLFALKDFKDIAEVAVYKDSVKLKEFLIIQDAKIKFIDFLIDEKNKLVLKGYDKSSVGILLTDKFSIWRQDFISSQVSGVLTARENFYQLFNFKDQHYLIDNFKSLEEFNFSENKTYLMERDIQSFCIKNNCKIDNREAFVNLTNTSVGINYIFPEDFVDIVFIIRNRTKDRFTCSKYVLAHLITVLFGLNLGCLFVLSFKQIESLYEKKSIFLVDSLGKVEEFSYLEEMQYFLDLVKDEFLFMKNYVEEGYFRLKTKKELTTNDLSFIGGNFNKNSFAEQFNVYLKLFGSKFEPNINFTSSGYKNGICFIAILLGFSDEIIFELISPFNSKKPGVISSNLNSDQHILDRKAEALSKIYTFKNARYIFSNMRKINLIKLSARMKKFI